MLDQIKQQFQADNDSKNSGAGDIENHLHLPENFKITESQKAFNTMWILLTLFAATMQAFRNAFQSRISAQVSATGATLARFLFALPFSILYLIALFYFTGNNFQWPAFKAIPYVICAALFQILATVLMVKIFQLNNYAVGAGLSKSEAISAAIIGFFFFGTQIDDLGFLGVLIGFIAVFLMSIQGASGLPSFKILVLGLGSGISFAMTSLLVRETSLHSGLTFPVNAGWTLVMILTIQVSILMIYLRMREPETIRTLFQLWQSTALVSGSSLLGSIGWFSAMALMDVAYVKTLGQFEVLVTILLSRLYLKETVKKFDYLGLILIAVSSMLVVWKHL